MFLQVQLYADSHVAQRKYLAGCRQRREIAQRLRGRLDSRAHQDPDAAAESHIRANARLTWSEVPKNVEVHDVRMGIEPHAGGSRGKFQIAVTIEVTNLAAPVVVHFVAAKHAKGYVIL